MTQPYVNVHRKMTRRAARPRQARLCTGLSLIDAAPREAMVSSGGAEQQKERGQTFLSCFFTPPPRGRGRPPGGQPVHSPQGVNLSEVLNGFYF